MHDWIESEKTLVGDLLTFPNVTQIRDAVRPCSRTSAREWTGNVRDAFGDDPASAACAIRRRNHNVLPPAIKTRPAAPAAVAHCLRRSADRHTKYYPIVTAFVLETSTLGMS